MPTRIPRRITLCPTSSLSVDSLQSLTISLLRGLAALQVAVAHLRAETFPGLREMVDPPLAYQLLAFATGFAHQAVVVFFLISGWLVGGSLLNKFAQPESLRSYAIDRISRLWTVLIPTFFLMLLCAIYMNRITIVLSNFDDRNEYSITAFVGNLFGLQTIAVPNFGRNYALWSLANETWYYLLFPLLLLVFRCRSAWGKGASAMAIAVTASFLPASILLYFSLWLLGAAFARVRVECNNAIRLALLLCCATLSIYFRLNGSNADLIVASYIQDLLCSIPLLFLLATLFHPAPRQSPTMRRVRSAANVLSDFSFTLYVTHVPAIGLLRHIGRTWFGRDTFSPYVMLDYGIYFCTVVLIIAIAYLIYMAFEANTFRIRRFLKSKLLHHPGTGSTVVTAPLK